MSRIICARSAGASGSARFGVVRTISGRGRMTSASAPMRGGGTPWLSIFIATTSTSAATVALSRPFQSVGSAETCGGVGTRRTRSDSCPEPRRATPFAGRGRSSP